MQHLLTQQNRTIDIRFHTDAEYPDPFIELQLDAVFTTPSGRRLEVPAFWAGGNEWRVRFSSQEAGFHQFQTQCSHVGDSALHGQTGLVEVQPYLGDNPLYRHGGIRVADDRRHFCHADGTPFFWLGDTWWMGLCGRLSWPQDFQALTQNRKALGFNVIQLVAGFYPDMPLFDERGRSDSGFCWETDLSRINPRFFDEADQRIFHLVEQGLTPCILGAWGYYLPMIGLDNMQHHWRYLIARWGALPVVWAAAGEQTMPWYLEGPVQKVASRNQLRLDWSQVIASMRSVNAFDRLITTHPVTSARESVADAGLLDFEMQQTGHGAPTAHHAMRAWQGWCTEPVMPVISAEARYEGLDIDPPVTAQHAREAFWAHVINSGLAGHTYGANGIWQVNTETRPYGPSPSGSCWGNLPWSRAAMLPGARQLGLAKSFLETLPWQELMPQPMLQGQQLGTKLLHQPRVRRLLQRLGWRNHPPSPVAVGTVPGRSMALAYSVSRQAFALDLDQMSMASRKGLQACWVDPVTFEEFPAILGGHGRHALARPDKQNAAGDDDWLLLLRPKDHVGSPETLVSR